MSCEKVQLRSAKTNIFLVGDVNHQIKGAKLPSNRQVLSVLFFNIREVKLTVSESANLVIRECVIFWEKARIPIKSLPNCVKKLMNLYNVWRDLQKNSKKNKDVFKQRENQFKNNLDNIFDIAHADALQIIKIEEDRIFLKRQREPGRPGYLAGVDKKLKKKEEQKQQKQINLEKRRINYSTPSTSSYTGSHENLGFTSSSSHDESSHDEQVFLGTTDILTYNTEIESGDPKVLSRRGTKCVITPKLVAALDRCQLSIRDSVYIIQATVEALGHNIDDFSINKSTIQRIRRDMRKLRAEKIKKDFNDEIPEVVTLHWDGKLLPALNVKSSKEERLPIAITFGNKEQLIAVPKLANSSGKEQAQAVWNAISNWNLEDKVEILCCDTTASNTGRFNGACVLLEQKLEKELLIFACRHHIYELVLKSVFEIKRSRKKSGYSTF